MKNHIVNTDGTVSDVGESSSARNILILTAVILICLVPFSGKAFHMDDTLFIWTARQIVESPLDFYGFVVNWYAQPNLMYEVTQNPPGADYYLAIVASVAGWGERAVHLGFLIPAVAVGIGTYIIAARFTRLPLIAALASVLTPVFFVSATNIMSDMLMLAFWCWAIVFWIRGTERGAPLLLFLSVLLISLATLTKYFGICLIPLLVVWSLTHRERPLFWAPWMLVPVAAVVVYQWGTLAVYGRGLFFGAARYSTQISFSALASNPADALIGLAFTGGCMITAFFYAPLLWSRRALLIWFVAALILGLVLFMVGGIGNVKFAGESLRWGFIVQLLVFISTGASLIWLAGSDLSKRRDPDSLFLLLWLVGTFLFAGFLNWTVNARTVLPLVPVAGIILARRLEERGAEHGPAGSRLKTRLLIPLVPSLVVSLMIGWADYGFANSAREAANEIYSKYVREGTDVWFQGHWGFQHYMESLGARAMEVKASRIKRGDLVVVPLNNTNVYYDVLRSMPLECNYWLTYHPSMSLATVSTPAGAGFYSSIWGPLPYVLGPKFEDSYAVCQALDEIDAGYYWRLSKVGKAR